MTATAAYSRQSGHAGPAATLGWLFLALAACLSVAAINGRPLFYFDTAGYVDQGLSALRQLGLIHAPAATAGGAGGGGDVAEHGARTVDGSRSLLYALMTGILAHFRALELMVLVHAGAVLLAFWIPMRVAHRTLQIRHSLPMLVAVPVIAAAAGSMPFFVAYLMPDIFAPVMLLCIGTLTVFVRQMRLWETLVTFALAAFSVMAHLSHVPIAALMVPVAALVSLVLGRRRWWIAPALVAALVCVALAQQAAFRVAAKAVSDSEVIIKPFITARLIQDKVGYDYLERHCPNPEIATCALWDALQISDDPYRLTASHIIFETSRQLGSFRLMTEEDQLKVVRAQRQFFFDVLRDAPVGTAFAFLKNTIIQTRMFSVDMTLPGDSILRRHEGVQGLAFGPFAQGRLGGGDGWLAALGGVHTVVYMVSALIMASALVLPGQVPPPIRALVLMALLGVLANAFVCGGISQPATRYGARVIWLFPAMAAVAVLFWRRKEPA